MSGLNDINHVDDAVKTVVKKLQFSKVEFRLATTSISKSLLGAGYAAFRLTPDTVK